MTEIKQIIDQISEKELQTFLHDNEKNPQTIFGKLYIKLQETQPEQFKYYNRLLNEKALDFGLIKEQQNTQDLQTKSLIREIKEDKKKIINNLLSSALKESSYFERVDILEALDLDNLELDSDILLENTNSKTTTAPVFYKRIKEIINYIKPISEPKINSNMTEAEIFDELNNNDDFLLGSKVKTLLETQKVKNETSKHSTEEMNAYLNSIQASALTKNTVHGAGRKDIKYPEQLDVQTVIDINTLQQKIKSTPINGIDALNDEITSAEQEIATVKDYLHQRELSYDNAQAIDLGESKDSLLQNWLLYLELSESPVIKSIAESIEKKIKDHQVVKFSPIFEGSEIRDLSTLKNCSVLIKKVKDTFYFNIVENSFINERNDPKKVSYTKNTKTKDTKEHQAEIIDLISSYDFYTNYIDDYKKLQKVQDNNAVIARMLKAFDVESISVGDKTVLLKNLKEEYEKQKSKKQFSNYLQKGNSYALSDGKVLWYSTIKKKYYLDKEEKTEEELYSVYKKQNADNNILENKSKGKK